MSDDRANGFRKTVSADLFRYGAGVSLRAFFSHYFGTPGFRYTFWMRASYFLRRRSLLWRPAYFFCRLMLGRLGVRYGISIPYNTQVGKGLYIGHFGGIVVNADAIIGADCNINHGVTVGVTYGGKNPGTPRVGSRVFMGPGCKIIGGISVATMQLLVRMPW